METRTWPPKASLQNLQARADIVATIRVFFKARKVLEVDTPIMCHHGVTDPYIDSLSTLLHCTNDIGYLQTSPEYCMKRLLAAGSGDIYTLCKAFRDDAPSKRHNPEFTMLEWYRIDFDHHQLMHEVDALLQTILHTPTACKITYQDLYQSNFGFDPHTIAYEDLRDITSQHVTLTPGLEFDQDTLLQLLFTHVIEPELAWQEPVMLYDFPVSQAALARIRHARPSVASRFEVYYKGIELANGFHELTLETEQRQRFTKNNQDRLLHGKNEMALDENFLAALQQGLPNCSGVALGVDRLIMLAVGAGSIEDVMSFTWQNA